jgi:DnaJ homolog subfamily A member 5
MNEQDENYMTKTKMKPYFSSSCHTGFDPLQKDNFF